MTFDPGSWTCHVCGDERPDRFISVRTSPLDLGFGVTASQNVRYCNDRAACREGSRSFSFLKDEKDV